MSAWIICGVAGSGKTTLALSLAARTGRESLDADDFHPQANLKKMKSGEALNEADREPWLEAIEAALRSRKGKPLVLAFPGLRRAHRERLLRAADSPKILFLKVSLAEAGRRLGSRGGFFAPELAPSQFALLEEPEDGIVMDGAMDPDLLAARALARLEPGQAGIIGLGRMGGGMARRLLAAGFEVCGLDPAATMDGVTRCESYKALAASLARPRRVLMSLPAGKDSDLALEALIPFLSPGDLVIDAANAPYRDAVDRARLLAQAELHFVDAGISGGVLGAEAGYSVMAGGNGEAIELGRPILESLAQKGGFVHCGQPGSGHFTKTIHNGMEYGMMQSISEGFAALKASKEFKLPLAEIAAAWTHGAVVSSTLLKLAGEALGGDPELSKFEGKVGQNGTGQWAAEEAARLGVATPALDAALRARKDSLSRPGFASKLLSALRNRFGGHREAQ